MASQRPQKEFMKLKQKAPEGCSVDLIEDNLKHWSVIIAGPEGSPFEGGKFKFEYSLPDNYPFNPPKVKCLTKVYHPNFDNNDGSICVGILKNDEWKPTCNIEASILAIQDLFRNPNASSPLDQEVAEVFVNDVSKYEKTAREYTKKYAK
ncbi:hypothetical protein ABK040_006922 [Willaertia magna]